MKTMSVRGVFSPSLSRRDHNKPRNMLLSTVGVTGLSIVSIAMDKLNYGKKTQTRFNEGRIVCNSIT